MLPTRMALVVQSMHALTLAYKYFRVTFIPLGDTLADVRVVAQRMTEYGQRSIALQVVYHHPNKVKKIGWLYLRPKSHTSKDLRANGCCCSCCSRRLCSNSCCKDGLTCRRCSCGKCCLTGACGKIYKAVCGAYPHTEGLNRVSKGTIYMLYLHVPCRAVSAL